MEKIEEMTNKENIANTKDIIEDDDIYYCDDNGGEDKRDKRDENKAENADEEKLEKFKAPKRRYAIIIGYLGHNYCGNQK